MSGRAEKSDKTKWWRWGAAAGIAALLGCAIAVGATGGPRQARPDGATAQVANHAAVFITSDKAGKAVHLPHVATGHPLTDPLTLIVSFYGFIEAFARHRGLDPDQPPNLRKVTETR